MNWWPFKSASSQVDPEQEMEATVTQVLQAGAWPFAAHPVAMNLYPDFLVGLGPAHPVVVEAWTGARESQELALRRLRHCVDALEISAGVLVSPQATALEAAGERAWLVGPQGLEAGLRTLRHLISA